MTLNLRGLRDRIGLHVNMALRQKGLSLASGLSHPQPQGMPCLTSLMISTLGFGLWRYGRKVERAPQKLGGLLLMVFPYFVPGIWIPLGLCLAICGAMYWATKNGY